MMTVGGLCVVSMFVVVGVCGRRECSQQENAKMQVQFNECATKLDRAHFEARDSIDTVEDLEAATCKLLSETIEDCGKIWKQCHGEEDIRVMKDMYINQLVAHYGQDGVEVNTCQIVKEFRESGRHTDESGSQDMCNGEKTNVMTRKFHDCSHSTSSAAYQVVMDITDPTSITDTLCKSLTTIGTVCAKTLKECYNKEDLNRMTNDHLREMKSFLLQFVEGKVKQDSLSNCPVLKNIDRPSEEQVFEDYDRTNDIDGNEPVHTPMNEEHPKETIEFNLEDILVKEDTTQVKSPVATTANPIELSKIESLKAEPENSTKEEAASQQKMTRNMDNSSVEAASQQKMTRNMDNSSTICLAERGVLIVSLFLSLMSCYVSYV